MASAGSLQKLAGHCVADCGGFLDRGDASYWLLGGAAVAILIVVVLGLVVLRRRRRPDFPAAEAFSDEERTTIRAAAFNGFRKTFLKRAGQGMN